MKRSFDTLMSAVTFAESGEFDTSRELMKEGKRILVSVNSETSGKELFRYASNICKRTGASLDVLYSGSLVDGVLANKLTKLLADDVSYRLVLGKGNVKKDIINYTNTHSDIIFAVVDNEVPSLPQIRQRLKCPLVVVSRAT